ncbi:MAG: ROK family protein [Proteobacteria bacterium]|nr:ROK family protein [Pseudomonadota bacterium]
MRFGIDLGGSKIEIAALADDGTIALRHRVPTPHSGYDETIRAIADLILQSEAKLSQRGTVGVAIPGALSLKTGLVKNANSTRLIGHPLDKDLAKAINRPVRVANDANCFTLSEAADGAAAGKEIVFGIIAGTGVGGGICIDGHALTGAHAITGEWGHNPLPGPRLDEIPGPPCYCGKNGCIESWCSGPALEREFGKRSRRKLNASDISEAAVKGDADAIVTIDAWLDRFSRAIASIVNVLDPHAIVVGGGLSNIDVLYREVPARVERYSFTPEGQTPILKNKHGDSSGVRGAAWLWQLGEKSKGLPP